MGRDEGGPTARPRRCWPTSARTSSGSSALLVRNRRSVAVDVTSPDGARSSSWERGQTSSSTSSGPGDLATEPQRARRLPGTVSGERVPAIAMTEPGAGSDLAAITTTVRRDGGNRVVDGAETSTADGTDPDLLGEEGRAIAHLVDRLPQERLGLAVAAVAVAAAAPGSTPEHVRTRTASAQPIGAVQDSRSRLAETATEVDVAQTLVGTCVRAPVEGGLTAVGAATATWWCTELQVPALDVCQSSSAATAA